MTLQLGWRNCVACAGTFFASNETRGRCPARADGGPHDDTGSLRLGVHHGEAVTSNMQGGWRRCERCQGMFFGRDGADAGVCPAGGAHRLGSSDNYFLAHSGASATPTAGWRWCSRCEGLFHTDGSTAGRCPGGGTHDPSTSGQYSLELDSTPDTPAASAPSGESLSIFAWDEFRIGVIGVGTDGQMRHRFWDPLTASWSGDWQTISGVLGSVPVACGSGGFIHFFACDDDGKPKHLIWDGTAVIARIARWDANGDATLNGTLRAVFAGGTCHLFGLDAATGEVLHGGWTASLHPNAAQPWTRCGRALSSLSALLVGSDIHLVGVDSTGAILQAVWSSTAGTCSDWKTLTTGAQGSVALALVGARVHCCFMLGDGSMAWGRYEASARTWVGTVRMGGGSPRSPTVAVVGQMLHVFALGTSGVVQHVGWDVEVSSPGRWDDCGGALAGAPAVVVMMGSTVQVAGVTSAGTASCLSWNAGTNTAISAWVDGGGTLSTTLKLSLEATPAADSEVPRAPASQPNNPPPAPPEGAELGLAGVGGTTVHTLASSTGDAGDGGTSGADDWSPLRMRLTALRARVSALTETAGSGSAAASGDDGLTSVRRAPWSAVGDGVADDTEALAGALASGAKAIFVPEGVYRITRTLVVPAGVRLFGAGLFASVLLFDLPRAPAEGAHVENDTDGRWRVEYGAGLLLDDRPDPRDPAAADRLSAAFGAAVEDLALVRSFGSAGGGAGHGGYAIGARVMGSARIRVYVHGGWRWGLYKRQSNAAIQQGGASAGGIEGSDLWIGVGDGLRLPAVARQAERAGGGVYVRGFVNACRLHVEIASLNAETKPDAVVLHGTYAAGNNLDLSGSIQGVGGAAVRVSGVGQGVHIHDLHVEPGSMVANSADAGAVILGATAILGADEASWVGVAEGVLRGATVGPNVSARVVVGSGAVNTTLIGVNGDIEIDQGAVETLVTGCGGASFRNASPTTRTVGWPRDLLTGFTPVGTAPMAGRNLLMDGNGERRCRVPADAGLHHVNIDMPWELNPIYTGIQRVRPAGGGTRSAPDVLHMWATDSGRVIYWRIAHARLAGLGGQPLCFSFKWRAIVQNSLPFLNISWGQLEPTQWGNLVDGVPCERGFSRAQIAFLVDARSLEDGKDLYIALTAGHLDPPPAGALEELYLSEFMLQVGAAASPDWIPGEWSEDQSARLTRGRLEVWKALPRQSGPQREGDESWPYDVSAEDRDPVQQRHYLRGDVIWDTTPSKSGPVGMICESGDATPSWRAISQRVGW